MIIFPSLRYSVDSALRLGLNFSICIFSSFFLFALFFYCFNPWGQSDFQDLLIKQNANNRKIFHPYEAIGSGGLMIRPQHAFGWVSRVAEELALIAFNSRPNVDSSNVELLFQLKNAHQEFKVLNGKILFLEEMQEGKGLKLSNQESGLWIKPILMDNGSVLMETGRKLSGVEGGSAEERGQFFLTTVFKNNSLNQLNELEYIKDLKSAFYLPWDAFMHMYGGSEYAVFKQKVILEFNRGTSSYACFLSHHDYLLYENGQWHMIGLEKVPANMPIGKVKRIFDQGIEIEVWDETGFYPTTIQIDGYQGAQGHIKSELLPAKLRLRNDSQISCTLGKRRVVLRRGDWLLRTASGWRNLRRADDIDHFLFHRLKGDLIIFDSIEKEQGKHVMKAHWFDETRMYVQPLSIPIEKENLSVKTSRRKPLK